MTLSVQIIQAPPAETVSKREFYLNEFPVTIGRDYSADVCLPDLSEQISRSHLLIFRSSNGRYQVSDVSTNGAMLNGDTIPPKTTTSLVDGDVLELVGYRLLVGLLETSEKEDEEPLQVKPSLHLDTDLSSVEPLMPDAEIEDIPPEPDEVFSQTQVDLDPDLMFDPFADGPKMDERPRQSSSKSDLATEDYTEAMANEVAFSEIVQLPDKSRDLNPSADFSMAMIKSLLYRENVNEAMERALDLFLDELDPANLQKEYDEFIPRFSRRKSRYWEIHLRQFAKRKSKGEYRRSFMALFAEEIRKL